MSEQREAIVYTACIEAVDGVRAYTIFSPDVVEVLAFLGQHDHEGSDVWLYVGDEEYQGEAAYKYLETQL